MKINAFIFIYVMANIHLELKPRHVLQSHELQQDASERFHAAVCPPVT